MNRIKSWGSLAAVAAACWTSSASAQITPVGDFYPGQYIETMEGYSSLTPVQCFRPASGVFQSTGTLCTVNEAGANTTSLQCLGGLATSWAGTSGCAGGLAAFAGSNFCGNSGATARLTINFNGLAGRFGGRFATNHGGTLASGATIEFFDENLNSIGTAPITFTVCNTAGWHWEGWQSDVGIKRIQIYGGARICLDNLTYDEYVAQPTGACCIGTGCITTTFINCANNGWSYLGDGVACDPDPCGTPATGACCIGEFCFIESAPNCGSFGGVYQGDDSQCSPNPCATAATGACCNGTTCSIATQADCAFAGGVYQGDFTACGDSGNPTTCCRANFDGTGGVAVPDIFAFLSAWFGNDPSADIDGENGIAVPDIFAFLSLWFAGCP